MQCFIVNIAGVKVVVDCFCVDRRLTFPQLKSEVKMSDEGTNVDAPPAKPDSGAGKGDIIYVIRRNMLNFGVLFGVWGIGYYRFSWSWLLIVGIVMAWRERHNHRKQQRMLIGRHASHNEKEVVLEAVRGDLPSWVSRMRQQLAFLACPQVQQKGPTKDDN